MATLSSSIVPPKGGCRQYVSLRPPNAIVVKRHYSIGATRVKVISDNKLYDSYAIDLQTVDIEIIGQIICIGRELVKLAGTALLQTNRTRFEKLDADTVEARFRKVDVFHLTLEGSYDLAHSKFEFDEGSNR